MGSRRAVVLTILFTLPVLFSYSVSADYDGDGIDDASDSDDDGDGVDDGLDSCPTGTLNWLSNSITDHDGDGCKDRNVIIDFYDTYDWSYQNFSFTIDSGQEFDIYHICHYGCHHETTITLTKPDGNSVFWGRHPSAVDDEMTSTFPHTVDTMGRLSQMSGFSDGVAYGDSSIEDSWNQPGDYVLNLTDLHEDYHEDGVNIDDGGISIFVYLVGDDDAEDDDDDNDGVIDSNDICMIGTTGWTANSQTDIDNDGCEDQSEDVDDDNDQVPDDSDLCTNRRSDSNDGNGLFNYPLTNSWSEESNGLNDAVPRGSPIFTSVNGVDALYLSGYDSVEFPMALSQGLNHSDKVQFSLEFKLDDAYFSNNIDTASESSPNFQGDVGDGTRVLISNQPNRDDRELGFSISVELFDEESFGLRLQVAHPTDNHVIAPILTRDLSFDQWYLIQITYDFTVENPTVEVMLGAQRFAFIITPTIEDIDCWKSHLTESPVYVGSGASGGVFEPEGVEVNGEWEVGYTLPSIGMFARNFSASSPIPQSSESDINTGLENLIKHMNGEVILDENGLMQSVEMVMMNIDVPWNSISNNATLYLDTYTSVEGLIFEQEIGWIPSVNEPLKYIAYTIQLVIIETVFTPENVALSGGIQFADAQNFPGLVKSDAQRVTDGTALIRGTYITDPGRNFGGEERLIQPTGYFAPAGEIVTITIPPENVDGGFVVWVGAHQDDLRYSWQEYVRFPKVGTQFPIDSATIQVANPFGGGIYIVTPDGAQEGDVSVSISGAVKSPLYSTREISQTTYSEWSSEVDSADTPWVDIMSDRFMTSLPTYMVDYSKDTLCHILDTEDFPNGLKSCIFTVPVGKTVTLEPMLHHDFEEISMAITYPNGTTEEYTIDSFNHHDWQSAPSMVFARESSQSGQYVVELFSQGISFQAAIMDHDIVFDPDEMLTYWDASMDAYLILGGWPLERGNAQQHMWLLPDVQTPVAGTRAPAANPMSMGSPVYANSVSESFTSRDLSWWADPRVVAGADFYDSGTHIVWHEWGHLHNYPTLFAEVEAIANLPAAIILNLAFGLSLDDSLTYSTFQMMNRSETAIDWMVTTNFRNDERIGEGWKGYTEEGYPLDQVSYQSRGNARYVDIAYMFGWEELGNIHNVYYQRILDDATTIYESSNPTDSDFVYTSSVSLGVNMAPFFDFWGLDINQETLDLVNTMPRSEAVKQLLFEYRNIIPQNLEEFTEWHDSIKSRIGAWQGPQVESYLETYDDATGQAGLDRIDTLLCLYFAINCDNVGLTPYPEQPTIDDYENSTNDANDSNDQWWHDSDGDGVPNLTDLCPGHDDLLDTDNDGIPNGCEDDADDEVTQDDDQNTTNQVNDSNDEVPQDDDDQNTTNQVNDSDDEVTQDDDGIPNRITFSGIEIIALIVLLVIFFINSKGED